MVRGSGTVPARATRVPPNILAIADGEAEIPHHKQDENESQPVTTNDINDSAFSSKMSRIDKESQEMRSAWLSQSECFA